MKNVKRPSVYRYQDFRQFLRDYHAWLNRSPRQKVTLQSFSRLAGFDSHSTLKRIMDGKRNISASAVEHLCAGLEFSISESQFFKSLVALNQAKSLESKRVSTAQLLRSSYYRKLKPLSQKQFRLLSQWYLAAIRELIATEEFKEDSTWIAQSLVPAIQPQEAERAIADLLDLQLIVRDEKGRLKANDQMLAVDQDISANAVSGFHRNMAELGKEAIDRFLPAQRNISGVTLSVSAEMAEKIWMKIDHFRDEVAMMVKNDTAQIDRVMQFNLQFFPLSDIQARKKGNGSQEE